LIYSEQVFSDNGVHRVGGWELTLLGIGLKARLVDPCDAS